MIDPEVARLRRLRDEALRVREIARRLGTARWGIEDPLLARGACAGWRIVRVVTGKLIEHPYLRYQQGAGVGSLIGNRLAAEWIALVSKDRPSGLKAYASELESLSRTVGDARALTRSTDFSDALGRSQSELKTLLRTLAVEIHGAETKSVPTDSVPLERRLPIRSIRTGSAARTDGLVGELAKGFEADWPYLAF
jgi:hypothetical protein